MFLSLLKLKNINPVHKKDSEMPKDHYRSVSILSVLSTISETCERFTFTQLSKYF